MLLGDSSVGKTCLLVRFKDGAFLGGNFIATVGIDFRVRDVASHTLTLSVASRVDRACMYVVTQTHPFHQSALSLRANGAPIHKPLSVRVLLSGKTICAL